jgi:hypothetical protein
VTEPDEEPREAARTTDPDREAYADFERRVHFKARLLVFGFATLALLVLLVLLADILFVR